MPSVIGQAQGRPASDPASSGPVHTPMTPGDCFAADVSIEVIRACA